MFRYVWPLGLVVLSNVFYQISAKSVPDRMNPFASLTITYMTGAIVSLIMYFLLNKGGNIIHEYQKTNWAPFVLGFVIVGLEVGYMLYKEKITWNKIAGILVCLAGLGLINLK